MKRMMHRHRSPSLSRRFSLAPLALLAAVALAPACGGQISTQEEVPAGELDLLRQTPEEVSGTFRRDGVGVRFAASKRAGQSAMRIEALDGRVLAVQTGEGAGTVLSLLGGRLVFKGAAAPMDTSGDPRALADLVAMPEAGVLPWLSQELGAQGIDGRGFPASFSLHGFAHFVATTAGIELPPLSMRMSLAAERSAQASGCKDLRGDPYRNGCYGMCGRGCGCWSWVCGDCCWHKGCANHDKSCRSCSLTNPKACAACASFSSFFTGGGC
jgi:hypothetical protein